MHRAIRRFFYSLLLLATPLRAQPPFDSSAAWDSFASTLRDSYAYLQQAGVDGPAILATFKEQALHARSDREFIDVLQLVAHNFADRHFVVGPLDNDDYAVIPTASDVFATLHDGIATIVDVRTDSAAMAQGIAPGHIVVMIDGRRVDAAISAVMGRPVTDLSPPQVNFALNSALAGKRNMRRHWRLHYGGNDHEVDLPATNELAQTIDDGPLLTSNRFDDIGIIRVNNSLARYELIAAFRDALAKLLDTHCLVIDLRNTPSGGNTIVARGLMGHFVQHDQPYQMHVIPNEERLFGVRRKFVEYVSPLAPFYSGRVIAIGGHWTGSMGEGLMLGFRAMGATTVGSDLAHLLGAVSSHAIAGSNANIEFAEEALFDIHGEPREAFKPDVLIEAAEKTAGADPAWQAAALPAR